LDTHNSLTHSTGKMANPENLKLPSRFEGVFYSSREKGQMIATRFSTFQNSGIPRNYRQLCHSSPSLSDCLAARLLCQIREGPAGTQPRGVGDPRRGQKEIPKKVRTHPSPRGGVTLLKRDDGGHTSIALVPDLHRGVAGRRRGQNTTPPPPRPPPSTNDGSTDGQNPRDRLRRIGRWCYGGR